MKVLLLVLATVFALLPTTAFMPESAPGDGGALVIVHRADVGNMCGFLTEDGGLFLGPATLVATPNGRSAGQCVMKLVDGPRLTSVLRTSGEFEWPGMGVYHFQCVLTPGKAGSCSFH